MLLRKHRSYAEVYNDLDGEIVNLFRVARDSGAELEEVLRLTPFARDEFLEAWYPSQSPVEQARRTLIRSFMGFGSAAITLMRCPDKPGRGGLAKTGFRANSNRSGTTPAHDWANYPDALKYLVERLQGVVIENKDAQRCMRQHDSPETLHYVDPPYMAATRDRGSDYRYELSDEDHLQLAEFLYSLEGAIVLSGYDCEEYRDLYPNWQMMAKPAYADGARARVECLWLSKGANQADMFNQAASK